MISDVTPVLLMQCLHWTQSISDSWQHARETYERSLNFKDISYIHMGETVSAYSFGSLVLLNMKWFLRSGSNKRRFFNSPIIWTWGEFRKVRLHEMRITVIFPSTCLSCMHVNGVYFGKLIFLNKTLMNMTYYTIDVIQTWLCLDA